MLQRRARREGTAPFTEKTHLQEGLPWIAEAGFLVAAATEEIFEEDLLVLASVLSVTFSGCVSDEQFMDRFEACANALENDGWEDRLDALAANLPASARPFALRAAAAALVADSDFSLQQIPESYLRVTDALGYPDEDAQAALPEISALLV